jgi:hypothetical protein
MTVMIGRLSMRSRVFASLLAAAVLFGPVPQAQPAKLRQLGGVEEMKSWFNANKAHARAIILLSPT